MVEAIGAELLKDVVKKLGSTAWKKIKFANTDLKTHIQELQDLKSTIKAALHGVDPFQASNDMVGLNIKLLQRALYVLDNFFDDPEAIKLHKEVIRPGASKMVVKLRMFCSSSNQIVSSFRTADKVKAVKAELARIVSSPAFVSSIITIGNPNQGSVSLESGLVLDTDKIIGRDWDRESIITQLFHSSNGIQSFSVDAIVGVGGLGKTALAQYIYNDERVKNHFDDQFWVSATPNSTATDILVKFLESVTCEMMLNREMDQLNLQLSRVMPSFFGKKCLLVLDNLWYRKNFRADWVQFRDSLRNTGAIEFRVLTTTRTEAVADIMGITDPYMLRELSENDSWKLLRYFAFSRGHEPEPGVEAIGEEIARMCLKNPLVIKVIGSRLAEKHTKRDWEAFKVKLASNSAFLMEEEEIMQTLKLSYNELGENLKLCAAYCSLFPKGSQYETATLVRIWMALGFVEFRDNMFLEDVAEEYVHDLLRLGFFEKSSTYKNNNTFNMHDVMHDLMFSIGKSKHQMIDSKTSKITDGVCHVFLCENVLIWGVQLSDEFNGKQLQSILKIDYIKKSCSYVDKVNLGSGISILITRFPNLKVLDLHDQDIKEVPICISELIHLRYLDLSRNPLRKLPNSITKLLHLLSLNVSGCRNLHKLPRDMSKMIKLRHLLLIEPRNELPSHNFLGIEPITHMPKGIGKLKDLQELNLFVVIGEDIGTTSSGSKGNVAANLAELGHLNNIKGELTIYVAGQSRYLVSEAPTAHLEKKTGLTKLTVDFNNSSEEDEMFLEALTPCGDNLSNITIKNYGGKSLPSWMIDDQLYVLFPKLVSIELLYCKHGAPFTYLDNLVEARFGELYASIGVENIDNSVEARIEERSNGWCGAYNVTFEDEQDYNPLEWVPGYSTMKEQLKKGAVGLSFEIVRGNGLYIIRGNNQVSGSQAKGCSTRLENTIDVLYSCSLIQTCLTRAQ